MTEDGIFSREELEAFARVDREADNFLHRMRAQRAEAEPELPDDDTRLRQLVDRHINAHLRGLREDVAEIVKAINSEHKANNELVADLDGEIEGIDKELDELRAENETLRSELAALRADVAVVQGVQRGEIRELKAKTDAA
jgi:ribosomal protein L29